MEYLWIYITVGAALLAFLIYRIVTSRTRARRKQLYLVRKAYGAVPKREYSAEELLKIRKYYDRTKEEGTFTLDDITWNDMDMDSIFIAMNHTFSSVGEEALYRMLRTPCFDSAELSERERLIRFFSENTEARENMSVDYLKIGRTKKVALIEYIGHFHDIRLKSDFQHILHIILLLLAVAATVVQPVFGIIAIIVVMGYNIYTYYSQKGKIEPYYVSLAALAYTVECAKKVAKHQEPELQKYTDELKEELKYVSSVSRNLKWLGGGSIVNSGGDLGQLVLDYIRMISHMDFVFFNHMVRTVRNQEMHLLRIMELTGYLEALISVSSYRETLPFYCNAELTNEKGTALHIKDGFHPLISEPVANSITESTPVLLTGSNASGKSTFLRMVGLSAILAQSVNTVPAHEYSGGFYRVYSSMALSDDVMSGDSYYIAEIKSLKRIMDAEEGEYPVLAFIDEILRGTNTVERIAASAEILKHFAEKGAFIFAATHDIELTHMLERLYVNYHFTEQVEGDAVLFTYVLYPGRATSRNAIKLLSVMGYSEDVVSAAEQSAARFTEEGTWQKL